ncbi:MAG: hypothetical protein JWN92_2948 [Candidatus Acidoferrum typicum]|nr:hypothetical protein [Candidatus Acidoferrum typicum]
MSDSLFIVARDFRRGEFRSLEQKTLASEEASCNDQIVFEFSRE